jgi:membrane dipeptidase
VLTRRRAIGWLGATTAALKLNPGLAADGYPNASYAKAIVIDALGGPGEIMTGAPHGAPLTGRALADARASGVTAANVTVCEVGNGPDRFEKAIAEIASVEHELNEHPDFFLKVQRASDLTLAKSTGRLGLIFGFQDTSMLQGELHRLEMFHDLGLRICQPTYNRRNLMGDGCLEVANGGLSQLGLEFIGELNRLHVLLDLSHAGRRAIAEGIAAGKAPMAITHTGCRALVDLPRNTDDSSLRALADKGGVAGIYFTQFLRASEQAHADDVVRHLEHAVDVCGEDHVGIGTDRPISPITVDDAFWERHRKRIEERRRAGIAAPGESADLLPFIPEYNEPRRLKKLADDLAQRGWKAARIEKILGGNFARLFAEVWTA